MTKLITLGLIVAGVAAVSAANPYYKKYSNTPVQYATDLECANCIRGGYNYCLWRYAEGPQTITSWNCTQTQDKWNIQGGNGTYSGYACSYGMDQINAIVGSCRPWLNQNLEDHCGPYKIDLSDSNSFSASQQVKSLAVNASCSYRIISKCGYPEAFFRIHNESLRGDFDVAWATNDSMGAEDEADGTTENWAPDWWGSSPSDSRTEYYNIGETSRDDINVTGVPTSEWNSCNSKSRNLWLVVTRVKDSTSTQQEHAARSLIGLEQYNPGGVRFPDFEVSFKSVQGFVPTGAVSMIAALFVAVFSTIAVLAF